MDREEKVLNWAAGMDGKRTLHAFGGLYATLGKGGRQTAVIQI